MPTLLDHALYSDITSNVDSPKKLASQSAAATATASAGSATKALLTYLKQQAPGAAADVAPDVSLRQSRDVPERRVRFAPEAPAAQFVPPAAAALPEANADKDRAARSLRDALR